MAKLRNLVFKMRILVAVPADGTRWVSDKGGVGSKQGGQTSEKANLKASSLFSGQMSHLVRHSIHHFV